MHGGSVWTRAVLVFSAALVANFRAAAAPSTGVSAEATAGQGKAVPKIMIDAGHGGSNRGARGYLDVDEKDFTLIMAKRLAARLTAAGMEVRLTREDDETLTLRQRTNLANAWHADLFISLHANASPSKTQRGYESYILSPRAIEVDSVALRGAAETPRGTMSPSLVALLDDVERTAAQWESAEIAATIQASLRKRLGKEHDRGVRQDAQHVLLGATMPAVLVELGFIDHPIEGKALLDDAVQAMLTEAVAEAITARRGLLDVGGAATY